MIYASVLFYAFLHWSAVRKHLIIRISCTYFNISTRQYLVLGIFTVIDASFLLEAFLHCSTKAFRSTHFYFALHNHSVLRIFTLIYASILFHKFYGREGFCRVMKGRAGVRKKPACETGVQGIVLDSYIGRKQDRAGWCEEKQQCHAGQGFRESCSIPVWGEGRIVQAW